MFLTAEIRTVDGKSLGLLVLSEKLFKSGKSGYHGQGKIEMNGVRFQGQCQLVGITPKSDAGEVDGEG